MLKGVIFDLDGTLLDSMNIWMEIDIAFLKNHGLPVEKDYIEAMRDRNIHDCAAYTKARYQLPQSHEEIMREWDQAAQKAYAEQVALKPGVKEYLHFLKSRHIRIAAATSSYRSLFMPALKRNGIADYFQSYSTKDEVPVSKTRPDVYLHAAEQLGYAPAECAVFEDILIGVRACRLAGFYTVAVADASSAGHEGQLASEADCFIRNLHDPRIYQLFDRG